MTRISNNSNEHEKASDNIIEDDELDYLLAKEKSLIAKRQYHSWTSFVSSPESHIKTSTRPSQPTLKSATENNDSIRISETPSTTDRENFLLPDLDLDGLFDDQYAPSLPDDQDLLPDLDLMGLFDDEDLESVHDAALSMLSAFEEEKVDSSDIDDQNEDLYLDVNEQHFEENEDTNLCVQEDYLDDLSVFGQDHREDNLFDVNSEPDWLALAFEVEEFEADIASEFEDVEVEGAVSREGRALQAAMELGSIFDFTDDDIQAIALIFERNGWSACRDAVIRELNNGVTITELMLASDIKEIWLEHYEFYSAQESNYRTLSWPTALRLVNSFSGYPDPEEVEQLLINLYYHWSSTNIQRKISRSFNEYLIAYVDRVIGGFEYAPEWAIEQENSRQDPLLLPPSSTDIPCNHDFELERALRAIHLRSNLLN